MNTMPKRPYFGFGLDTYFWNQLFHNDLAGFDDILRIEGSFVFSASRRALTAELNEKLYLHVPIKIIK